MPLHVMELGNVFQKNRLRRIYARTVHRGFWLASYEQSTKYKLKYSLDQYCFEFETKRNVNDVFN